MRVFLTGATGFIGSRIIPQLQAAGHQVLELTRSDAGAQQLLAVGAEVHRGTLEDLDSLRSGAAQADAVIHTAFDHDFSRFMENCEKDTRAITALCETLKGTSRPLIITSGTAIADAHDGRPATENHFNENHANPRVASELAGRAALAAGVDVRVVRLPQVHDPVKQGLITYYVAISREKGRAAYIGGGANRWPAAHIGDVAELYRLVLDKGRKGACYHAVAEEGIAMRDVVEVVGQGLHLPIVSITPEQAPEHFGWLAMFAALDMPASSAWTREQLGWEPKGPGLIADLKAMNYADPVPA